MAESAAARILTLSVSPAPSVGRGASGAAGAFSGAGVSMLKMLRKRLIGTPEGSEGIGLLGVSGESTEGCVARPRWARDERRSDASDIDATVRQVVPDVCRPGAR